MNERIKQIRIIHKLTQQEFADRLKVSRSNIANYENGNRVPIDAMVVLICREFGVSETWLRTGEGEMFTPVNRDKEIEAFIDSVLKSESDDFRRRMIAVLSKLDTAEWELLEKMALKLAGESKPQPKMHVIKIAGRDGSFEERHLTDEEYKDFRAKLDSMPPVPDNI